MGQFDLLEDLYIHPTQYRLFDPFERPGKVLILQAKDDTGFTPDEREALRQSYPGAIVHLFESGGHLAGITQRAAFEETLFDFLAGRLNIKETTP